MYLQGSYTALRNNSKAAMLAAIEVYNKPQIAYRDECFVILLVNAWELLLKATLSKNKQRIYYPKKRGQPYRTLSVRDSLTRAKPYFPKDIDFEPVALNLDLLIAYRDNAIHFYNQKGFGVVVYGLAQTNIKNYRDLLFSVLGIDVQAEMTISLLPLSFDTQPDPVEYLQNTRANPPKNKAVAQYLRAISDATQNLEAGKHDLGRFLTVFKVSMKSVKKVSAADVVVGVDGTKSGGEDVIAIERRIDPNISHPLRQTEILARIGDEVNGVRFTSYTFQAIIWYCKIKEKPHLCWKSSTGELTRYSHDVVAYIKRLAQPEIETALDEYRRYQSKNRTKRKAKQQINP